MALLPFYFHTYQIDEISIELAIPEEVALKEGWKKEKINTFPFWGKSWPAAEALAKFISSNRQLFYHQRVLEIGGGLGLPSLIAAQFTKSITCSDYLSTPLAYVTISAKKNHLPQVITRVLNWHHIPYELPYDIILLSDINYDPVELDHLYKLISDLIQRNIIIVLSTPQRLIAAKFIQQLTPWIIQQEQTMIGEVGVWTGILSNTAKTDNI